MAIIRKMILVHLERDSKHSEVNATYTIVRSATGEKFLQIDTYGSDNRQEIGKKSQSIRFSPEAISQLKGILEKIYP